MPRLNIFFQSILEYLSPLDLGMSWILIMTLELFSNNRIFIGQVNIVSLFKARTVVSERIVCPRRNLMYRVLTLLNLRISKIKKHWLPSASYCLLFAVVDSFCVYPSDFTLHSICELIVHTNQHVLSLELSHMTCNAMEQKQMETRDLVHCQIYGG